jgi:SRSO17 transposase
LRRCRTAAAPLAYCGFLVDRDTVKADHRTAGHRAGVEVGFATKPQLGVEMSARAHDAGVLAGWVTADEAFGQNRVFRGWLAARGVPFVLATRSDDTLTCPDGASSSGAQPRCAGRLGRVGTPLGRAGRAWPTAL